jgi:hypothetical protein
MLMASPTEHESMHEGQYSLATRFLISFASRLLHSSSMSLPQTLTGNMSEAAGQGMSTPLALMLTVEYSVRHRRGLLLPFSTSLIHYPLQE